MGKDWILSTIVIIFVLHSFILGFFVLYQTQQIITGKATQGEVQFCINNKPTMDLSNCSTNLTQDVPYYCLINATDADNDTLIFSSYFLTERTVFAISPLGIISFTPENDDVGNHTANITVDDSACPGSAAWSLFSFSVINVNDPPYLNLTIPDQFLTDGVELRSVFLNDHFADPDGDILTYTHTLVSSFNISIAGDSQLIITPTACPAQEYIIFTAQDPYNLSADSNPVLLNCTTTTTPAEEEPAETPQTTSQSSGGGAGITRTCIPKLYCYDWEECKPDGRQRKQCLDENGCDDDILYLYRECEYITQCHNNVRDWNEDGIDCGGPCPACPTCFDGIKNGIEEDIDCGGNCDPCIHSLVAFGEYAPTGRYKNDIAIKDWTLTIANIQKKNVTIIEQNLNDIPYARFSKNASTLFYLKENDIWRFTSGLSRRFSQTADILSFSPLQEHIYSSRENFIDSILYPRLAILDINTLISEDIAINRPVFFPDAAESLLAYQTKNYQPVITKRAYLKTFSQYIFGKVLIPEDSEIYVVDETYEDILKIRDSNKNLYSPRFSPDGKYLVYVVDDGIQTDIMLASVDGTLRKKLSDTPGYQEIFPLFSRDGNRILFAADYDGKYALYTTNLEGNDTSVLLSGPQSLIPFDWYYSPSCFDGVKNQDETDIDCGGFCGPCGTCDDGIKNQNEIGIDCGGVCPPCIEETPQSRRNQMYLLYIAIGVLLILILLFILFSKHIKKYLNKYLDRILKREHREILLDLATKRHLLRRITEAEHAKIELKDKILLYTLLAREYLRKILLLNAEFDYTVCEETIKKMPHSHSLKHILIDFAKRLSTVEFGSSPLKEYHFIQYLEELRTLILITSEKEPSDLKIARAETGQQEPDEEQQLHTLIREIYIALQFEEVLAAKRKYVELHHAYRALQEHRKQTHFENIRSVYNLITYVSTYL